ncbi:MAG: hypothetical protein R3C30_11640 [Hyphomonadaceae bacterium]
MKKILVDIPHEVFWLLSRHACSKDITVEKLAARFLCGAYCADEYDDLDAQEQLLIFHAWSHVDPDAMDTDEGVRAYYDMLLEMDD